MYNGFPRQDEDTELRLRTLERLLANIDPPAVVEAARRFAAGEVQAQSMRFAPTVAEFTAEARKVQQAREAAQRPMVSRPVPASIPLSIRNERLRTKYAHRPVLFEDINDERFKQLSREQKIPTGASWVAALATIYGPEPKQ